MSIRAPMPELCDHNDPAWCSPECEEKSRQFNEWLRANLKPPRRERCRMCVFSVTMLWLSCSVNLALWLLAGGALNLAACLINAAVLMYLKLEHPYD